jgi:putative ABC transport system ATP-binding protein
MSTEPILSVEHLNKVFKSGERNVKVLIDVSFAIEPGNTCAIVGPSGSGKTTLIAICAGLERPSSGSVRFDGVALHSSSEEDLARLRNQSIGFIFQNFQLLPSLTALENVMVPAELAGHADAEGAAQAWLQRVGLAERTGHRPQQLSGGEQQRVALARAFVNGPRILFADEPVGNLDADTGRRVADLLFELNANSGATLVVVTHDLELAQRAGRHLQIHGGRVVADERNAAPGAGPAA